MTIHSVQVQITRKWIPEGKKNFKLQDSSGVIYDTFPNDAEKVQEGQSVMLDYEDKEFNGRPYKQTKRLTVTQGGTPMPAPVQTRGDAPSWQQPPGSPGWPAAPLNGVPRPSNGPPVDAIYPSPSEVFVREIVKGAMESGNFQPEDIDKLTKHALGAFNISFRQGVR